jgi:hypothetical protein
MRRKTTRRPWQRVPSGSVGSWSEDRGSLDLIVRGGEPRTVLMVRGNASADEDVEFVGTLGDAQDVERQEPVVIRLMAEDLARLEFSEPDAGEVSIYYDGELTEARITSLSVTYSIQGQYQIYSGIMDNGFGHRVEYFAIVDPLPVVVVGGAVLVAACAVLSGISFVMQKLEAKSSGFIEACRARGGYAIATPELGIEFSLKRRAFGCKIKPRLRCVGPNGETLATESGASERLHPDEDG